MDWHNIAYDVGRIVLAYLLALPIGWDREREAHSIGVRTFPLVAMASCAYVLLGADLNSTTADAQSRVIQGLLTGVGFIGAGAILKGQAGVHGTATAASIFVTGVIGASVALGRYDLAVILAALNLLTLRILLKLKQRLNREPDEETEI